jgi:dephospho-CoA kinase
MTLCERSPNRFTRERSQRRSMPVIGLIGGIGSGKSEVAARLAERGVGVIDADLVGHELLDTPEVRSEIVDRFGTGVLKDSTIDGTLSPRIDRGALASIVFADAGARHALEAILHPRMRERFLATIEAAWHAGASRPRALALDAAVLLEAGWDDLCDLVVFVDAPRATRLDRVARQRGWTLETLKSREQAQWPCELKRDRADLIINNDGDLGLLPHEVDRLDQCLVLSTARAVGS